MTMLLNLLIRGLGLRQFLVLWRFLLRLLRIFR
jgi:hypothetical protein